MKKFEIELKVGNDTGNSEHDIIINGTLIRQANVYANITKKINLEELDYDKFIKDLENKLVVSIGGSARVRSGDYYLGNYALVSGARVKNIEVGAGNNKVDSEACFINTLGQISAYAIKEAYKKEKDVCEIDVKVDMTTALPIAQYSKLEAQRLINKYMEDVHRLTVKTPQKSYHVMIKFDFVKVIPEGVTATFELIGDNNHKLFEMYNHKVRNNTGDKLYREILDATYFKSKERRVLHIAIGEGTTEFPLTRGIAFDPNFVEGTNNGVGHAMKVVKPLMDKEFRTDFSRQELSKIIKDKTHKYHQDLIELIEAPLRDEAEVIYRKAIDELEKARNEVDLILAYGGGSILMRKHLEKDLENLCRKTRVKLLYVDTDNAVTLEAKGLYNFTNSAIFKTLKERQLAVAK